MNPTEPIHNAISIQDTVTFWIAIVGFLLSLASWIKEFITQRKKLNARIFMLNTRTETAYLDLLVENHSRIPVAITQIAVMIDGDLCYCSPLSKLVEECTVFRRGREVEHASKYSTSLPIQLSGLGAVASVVLFEHLKQPLPVDATSLTFVIYTNRGKPVQMTLALPKECSPQKTSL